MEQSTGFVYVLWNPVFQFYGECYKIGCTNDLNNRINAYVTSYPESVEIKYVTEPRDDFRILEKTVHDRLKAFRMNSRREFFKCPLSHIISTIQNIIQYGYQLEDILSRNKGSTKTKEEKDKTRYEILERNKKLKEIRDKQNEVEIQAIVSSKNIGKETYESLVQNPEKTLIEERQIQKFEFILTFQPDKEVTEEMYKDLNTKKQAYRNLCELQDFNSFTEILRYLLQKHRDSFVSDDPGITRDIIQEELSSISLIDRSSSYNLIETNHLWIKMYYATLLMSVTGMPDFWSREVFAMNYQDVCQFLETHQEYLIILFNIKFKKWDEEITEASRDIEIKNQAIRKMNEEIEQKNNKKKGKKGKLFKLKPLLELWDHFGLRTSCMKFCSSILKVFGVSFQLENHNNAGIYICTIPWIDKWNITYRKNQTLIPREEE